MATVVKLYIVSPLNVDWPLKYTPPIKNLTLLFFGYKNDWSKADTFVEVVSFVTNICEEVYFELIFDSMFPKRVKSGDPIGN